MIRKEDILHKCLTHPGLQSLNQVIAPRQFTQEELEAIDFTIELFISMQQTISHLNDILINKLETWLASIKATD